jgi:hypothetical protein
MGVGLDTSQILQEWKKKATHLIESDVIPSAPIRP